MSKDTFGFERKSFTDHTLATHLRKHGAIDNHQTTGRGTIWRNASGRVVVLAIYSGAGGMDVTYYVPKAESPIV